MLDGVTWVMATHREAEDLINIGAYESAESVEATEAEMRHLHGLEGTSLDDTPALKPVVDPKVRTAELGNWLKTLEG